MRELTTKDLIILAYRGIEATEKETAEIKECLSNMFNKIIEQEKLASVPQQANDFNNQQAQSTKTSKGSK